MRVCACMGGGGDQAWQGSDIVDARDGMCSRDPVLGECPTTAGRPHTGSRPSAVPAAGPAHFTQVSACKLHDLQHLVLVVGHAAQL